MLLDPEIESPSRVYAAMIRAITPRPIAWVSTVSENGIANLAPFSYFNGICSKPAALMFSPVNKPDGSKKDTVLNIEANNQFVVNVVPYALSKKMFATAADFDFEVSEFEEAGLTQQGSQRVDPPSVAESPVRFECEVIQIVNVGEGPLAANVIIGKILLMDIADTVLDDKGKIDPELLDTVGRMGGLSYCRTTDRFEIKTGLKLMSEEKQNQLGHNASGNRSVLDDAIELVPTTTVTHYRWPLMVEVLNNSTNPEYYRLAWENCFANWNDERNGPAPIWFPPEEIQRNSNAGVWMKELGITDFSKFHRWSVKNRAEFWGAAVEKLQIQFSQPYSTVLDESMGASKAGWFTDARMNIVDSCFQAPDDAVAMVVQRPGQPIRQVTYGQLKKQANQVSNSLVDAGCKLGDAVAVVLPMTAWSVPIYLGIVQAGCMVVSIADSFAPPEIASRLAISKAKLVFTYDYQVRAGKKLPLFKRVADASDTPCIVLNWDEVIGVDVRDQDLDWGTFLVERDQFETVQASAQETINILFSSGTTGDPKAIPWSHLTPIKCAVDGYCHQDIRERHVCAWPTNLGWMMGPWLIFASLINRATIGLYEDAPMGAGFGEFVQDAKVNMLGVVPTIVKAWQSTGDMEPFDWSAIHVFSSTGESSQRSEMVYLSSLAGIKPIIEYCGGTEIGGGYVTSSVMEPNVPAAFNTPALGLDFVLIGREEDEELGQQQLDVEATGAESSDSDAEPVSFKIGDPQDAGPEVNAPPPSSEFSKNGDQGEVFLVPPSVGLSNRLVNRDHFATYYKDTPKVEGYGQLRRHGDHFQKLPGGLFVAGGRADDTMNLGGIKISSAEIERVLNTLDAIRETAAVAVAKSGGASELIVFVVSAEDEIPEGLQKTMNVAIRTQLNPLFKISRIILADALPRTASGKVMRRKLRDRLSSH